MPWHLQPGIPDQGPGVVFDALSNDGPGWGSDPLPGQHVDPGWADRLDAHHLAVACQSSAAVLAREGRGDDARVLRDVAAQAQTRIYESEHQHPEHEGPPPDGDGWPALGLYRWNHPAQRLAPPMDDLARGTHPGDGSRQRQEDGG